MQTLMHPGDTQKVELLGRNRLIDELLRDDLEVALPVRDHGIDLIAYADLGKRVSAYASRPIQMKAAWGCAYGINRKYEKFPGLVIAYVWNLGTPQEAVTYAMDYTQALAIAEDMGWTRTPSWERGGYSTNSPSRKLVALLEPFKMSAGSWWRLIVEGKKNTPA